MAGMAVAAVGFGVPGVGGRVAAAEGLVMHAQHIAPQAWHSSKSIEGYGLIDTQHHPSWGCGKGKRVHGLLMGCATGEWVSARKVAKICP